MCIYIYVCNIIILQYYIHIYIIHHSLRGGWSFLPSPCCNLSISQWSCARTPPQRKAQRLHSRQLQPCAPSAGAQALWPQPVPPASDKYGWMMVNIIGILTKGSTINDHPIYMVLFEFIQLLTMAQMAMEKLGKIDKNLEKLTIGTQKDQTKPFDNGKSSKWGYVQTSFSERIAAGTIFGYDWFSLIGGIGN